jgi:hypothetical protein
MMIPAAYLCLSATLIVVYHAVAFIGRGRFIEGLKMYPFHFTSFFISSVTFMLDASGPSPHSWFTLITYLTTLAHHAMAVFPGRKVSEAYQLATIALSLIIAGGWASCAILAGVVRPLTEICGRRCKCAILALNAAEAFFLLASGACDIKAIIDNTEKAKVGEARKRRGSKSV